MKVIVAGSRTVSRYADVKAAIEESGFDITEVVSGGAKGADRYGELWAARNGVEVMRMLPDWSMGPSAGPRRNADMANYAEALVAVHADGSRGTKNMIELARKKGLKVYVKIV